MPKDAVTGFTLTTYRRRISSDTWHFVKSCYWWPTKNFKVVVSDGPRPGGGELCDHCKAKERRLKCTSI